MLTDDERLRAMFHGLAAQTPADAVERDVLLGTVDRVLDEWLGCQ